jgi:hypothetical protein
LDTVVDRCGQVRAGLGKRGSVPLRSAALHTQRGTHLSPQSLDRTPFPPNNKDNIADMTSFLTGPHTEHKPGNLVSKAVCCRHHQTVGRSGCLACAQLPAPCPTSCHFTHTCSSDYGCSSWRPCPCTTASAMPSGHSVLQVGNVLHSLFSVSHLKIAAAGVPQVLQLHVSQIFQHTPVLTSKP